MGKCDAILTTITYYNIVYLSLKYRIIFQNAICILEFLLVRKKANE